ncbi:MAG: hypothetical protein HY286_07345 [Planctomycetes bacterium]|nr:hypothetical protein [Planctomycetota bacterium]
MSIQIESPIQVKVSGRSHVFSCAGGQLGTLIYNKKIASFAAAEGLPLSIRREPGITASHYQMWNVKASQGGEFFGASYRWSIYIREIRVHYGNNDYLLVARPGWMRGYDLVDNKRKRILSIQPSGFLSRNVTITIDKIETELACIVFAYFLARTTWVRSVFPGASLEQLGERKAASDAATQAATRKAEELAQAMMPGGVKKAGLDQ